MDPPVHSDFNDLLRHHHHHQVRLQDVEGLNTQKKAFAGFLLAAGVGHAGGEQQRVDGGLSDDEQKRSVGLKNLPVRVEGASDGHHGCGRRRLAALLVHLRTTNRFSQLPVGQSGPL